MKINGFPVLLKYIDHEVVISFDVFSGTLKQMLDFRKSFDYECYIFGTGFFTSAKWETIIADDHTYQKYPNQIGLRNQEKELTISWSELENLIKFARQFASTQ